MLINRRWRWYPERCIPLQVAAFVLALVGFAAGVISVCMFLVQFTE